MKIAFVPGWSRRFGSRARWLALTLLLAMLGSGGAFYGLHRAEQGAAKGKWVPVLRGESSQPIVLDGQLEPGEVVNITAPFDGKITVKSARTGDRVARDSLLLQLVSTDLVAEQRDAQAGVIRAQQALEQVKNWKGGAEFLTAQRQLNSSKTALETAQRRLAETESLFDQGIVPRNELEGARNEVLAAQTQMLASQDGVTAAREKGGATAYRLAQLELANRVGKLAEINAKLGRARVLAPIDGVVLAPPAPMIFDGTGQKKVEVGSFVTNRDTLMTIGDTTTFMVRASLDEFDISRVKTGLPVELTLNSNKNISLKGELVYVSSQAMKNASASDGGSRAALFDIRIAIRSIAPAQRAALRIGMGVRLQMNPEAGQTALLVPLAAVVPTADGGAQLWRRSPGSTQFTLVKVRLGKTLADQVEVIAGVTEKDAVWVPPVAEVAGPETPARPGLPGLKLSEDE